MGKKFFGETLVGDTFGQLTVREFIINEKPGSHWICDCSCGGEKIVSKAHLTTGKVKTCGKCDDIKIGTRFGKLVIIGDTNEKSNSGHKLRLVKCDCGSPSYAVRQVHLKSGHTTTCGKCTKYELKGKKFGKLTIIDTDWNNPYRNTFYICKCDCGGETTIVRKSLLNGETQSCGCINSKGEEKIAQILTEYNISYKKQENFIDLRTENNGIPKFDFGIYENNKLSYLIEYDGILHFQYSNKSWNTKEKYEQQIKIDELKNKYCLDNNIPLIRIPYWDFNKINIKMLTLNNQSYVVQYVEHYKKQEE